MEPNVFSLGILEDIMVKRVHRVNVEGRKGRTQKRRRRDVVKELLIELE